MKTLRLLAAALLTLGFLLGLPVQRAAASCASTADDPRIVAGVDAIFTGRLVGNSTAQLGAQREYTFAVDQVYKGEAYQEQIVTTTNRGEDGLELSGTGPYLVLARYGNGVTAGPVKRLVATACDGTVLQSDGTALLSTLGTPHGPTAGSSKTFTPAFTSKLWIAIGFGCIFFAIMVTVRSRRTNRGQP